MSARLRTTLVVLAVAAAVGAAACYEAPALIGPYRCQSDATCGDGSLVCDDGLCCQPFGTPACRTLVLDGGVCASGAAPQTWYLDKDEDGHGDVNSARVACARPLTVPEFAPEAQWIERGGDCNDDDPGIRPGATEHCDDIDNDCDDQVDELFAKQTYYVDRDQDGFGLRNSQGFLLCAPDGEYTSTDPRDCDDAASKVNPDATELCNGVDDDCDDAVDDAATDVGAVCASGLPGVCAPGTVRCVGGAPACVADVKVNERPEACNGLDDDCDNEVDEGVTGVICLLAPARAVQRAEDSGRVSGGTDLGCLAGKTGATAAGFASPLWVAKGGGNTQVFIARQGASTGKWNVTTRALDLTFTAELDDPAGAWSAWKQPAVFLCATDGTYARYIHTSDTNWNAKGYKITVNESFSLNLAQFGVHNGWTQTEATPPLDRINWVEIHLESTAPVRANAPPFTVTWGRLQLR